MPNMPGYTGNGSLVEPPPPYIPTAFVNAACAEGADTNQGNNAVGIRDGTNVSSTTTPAGRNDAAHGAVVPIRPAIGEPPPMYTSMTAATDSNGPSVGYEALPEKPGS